MTPTIWTFLIVCPLVFIAGFVDSVAGGGGVISLPAYLLAGIPMKFAAGTNKLANGFGTALASYRYARSGNIEWVAAIPAAIFALIGSALGTKLAVYLPDRVLEIIMLTALPIVAIVVFFSKGFGDREKPPKPRNSVIALASLIGVAIGFYDGLIGPGTGTFLTLAFSAILGFSLLRASGCARMANLASNVASLIVFLINGKVLFSVGIPAIASSMLGNYFGSKYAIKGGSSKIRLVMFIVLALLFIRFALKFLKVIDF